MTAAELAGLLTDLGACQPLLLAGIFVASFVMEDLATIAAALLAAQGLVDPPLAIATLCVGTATGDIGLHLTGRFARRHPWVERQQAQPAIMRASEWLFRRRWSALFVARFVPGLRLPAYLVSGLIAMPSMKCALVIAIATILWTPSLFLLSMTGWSALSTIRPELVMTIATLVLVLARWGRRTRSTPMTAPRIARFLPGKGARGDA